MRKTSTVLAASLAFCVSGAILNQAQAEPVSFTFQSAYNPNIPGLGDTAKYFRDRLELVTGGDLDFKWHGTGELAPTFQIFDAVSDGTVDAGYAFSHYWADKIPAAPLFGAAPFGFSGEKHLAWIYKGGGLELYREVYAEHDVVPVPCGFLPPETSGWFREPVESIEDFKGMNIRYAGLAGEVLRELGASAMMMPAEELFPNLERGVLDATEFSVPSIDQILGFHKVASHMYFPGWHQPGTMLELLINKDKWDGLSEAQQAAIDMSCRDALLTFWLDSITQQSEVIAQFEEEGAEVHTWSDDMLDEFRRATEVVLEREAAEDEDFARVLESMRTFESDNARWYEVAYTKE